MTAAELKTRLAEKGIHVTGVQLAKMIAMQDSMEAAKRGTGKGKPGGVPEPVVAVAKELTGPKPRPLTEYKLGLTRQFMAEGLGRRAIARKLGCGQKLAMRYIEAVREAG